jgi:hypothetical protein
MGNRWRGCCCNSVMTCPHATPTSERVNACGLGLHGGRPSAGVCAYCISRGENTLEFAAKLKATPPSLPQQTASLGKSLLNWTASGFSPTPPEALATREATCRACPEWDAQHSKEPAVASNAGARPGRNSAWPPKPARSGSGNPFPPPLCPLCPLWSIPPSRSSKHSEARVI